MQGQVWFGQSELFELREMRGGGLVTDAVDQMHGATVGIERFGPGQERRDADACGNPKFRVLRVTAFEMPERAFKPHSCSFFQGPRHAIGIVAQFCHGHANAAILSRSA